MLEILRDRELVSANPYSEAKVKQIHNLPYQNFEVGFYGGRVKFIAELKDSDLFLLVSNTLETVDIAREEKPKEIFTCKKCNSTFDGRGSFLTHTRICK